SPMPEFYPAREGEILHSLGSPDAASEVLGFQANVSLAEGLRDLVEENRKSVASPAKLLPQVA
ncbi:MAG: hypothetical protein AAF491_07375, partial [Verrucomicrobiota bacterium]